jgi:ATP-dependent DNA ligase
VICGKLEIVGGVIVGVLPVLYHVGKSGGLYRWRVWSEGDRIFSEYGLVDGELQVAERVSTPKNVGRSNATSAVEQAELEAAAMWRKKRERKYFLSPEEARGLLVRPMLAVDYFKRRDRGLEFPLFVQPKLDGMRALVFWDADVGRWEVMSRSGKSYVDSVGGSVAHLVAAFEALAVVRPEVREWFFDGEIYRHGVGFQQLTRLLKKYRPGESELLEFHAYDVVRRGVSGEVFSVRVGWLESLASVVVSPLVVVPCRVAGSEDEVFALQGEFVAAGFEGAMARVGGGSYEFGARSFGLLKVKSFLDAEFPIVGFKSGVGKFADAVIWSCRTPGGVVFDVSSRGSMEERRAWLREAEGHVGSLLTVRFFELSEDGVPRFPVGVGFRLVEDLPGVG